MTEIEVGLIRRKLAVITRDLGDLGAVEALSVDDYRRDRFRLKGTERLLQEVVEAAVDVNLHLLKTARAGTPPDYHDSFVELGRHRIIPDALAQRLAPSAGLRNRLVHEYDAIDDAIVLSAVKKVRADFAEYVAAVEQFLAKG